MPFFSTKRDGRGIGLTVVREILDAHGCDFSLAPRAGAPGAIFRLAFPRRATLAAAAGGRVSSEATPDSVE